MDNFTEIKEIISEHSGVEKDQIREGSHLRDDLNLDPLSIADIIINLEDKFKIKILQENSMKFNLVSDIVEFIEDNVDDSD